MSPAGNLLRLGYLALSARVEEGRFDRLDRRGIVIASALYPMIESAFAQRTFSDHPATFLAGLCRREKRGDQRRAVGL